MVCKHAMFFYSEAKKRNKTIKFQYIFLKPKKYFSKTKLSKIRKLLTIHEVSILFATRYGALSP